jgi:hypothetical protein
LQVLDLAHSVSRPVPLVEGGQSFAREGRALVTVTDLVLEEQIAILLQVGAGLAPGPASGAIRCPNPFALDVVRGSQIGGTHVAVHAAWRNQLPFHMHLSMRLEEMKSSED